MVKEKASLHKINIRVNKPYPTCTDTLSPIICQTPAYFILFYKTIAFTFRQHLQFIATGFKHLDHALGKSARYIFCLYWKLSLDDIDFLIQ